MGKRRSKKKKKRVQTEPIHQKGHESGPEEATGSERLGGSCSPAWNSLDEESLADYVSNVAGAAGDSGEEVEVAKLLSFLNFSVIPSLEPFGHTHAQGPQTDVDLLSELTSATHLEWEKDGEGGSREEGGAAVAEGDRDKKRENRKRTSRRRPNKRTKKLRSSAAADFMCPRHFVRSADHQRQQRVAAGLEEEGGGRNEPFGSSSLPPSSSRATKTSWMAAGCVNGGDFDRGCWREKKGKTTSRRKSSSSRFDPLAARRHAAAAVCGDGRWSQSGRGGGGGGGGRGTRSESSTPVNLPSRAMAQHCLMEMECSERNNRHVQQDFSTAATTTDTSATGEVEMGVESDEFDHTPPANPSADDDYVEDQVEEEEEEEEEEEDEDESELSETTTDSGCDGDDEESSVERVGGALLPGWWEREPPFVSSNEDSDSDDQEKLTRVLSQQFPQVSSTEVVSKTPRSLGERLEFKHPGKVGIRGSRNSKKKRCKPPSQPSSDLTPSEVNSKIAAFIQNPAERELRFALVSRAHCRTIHHLAAVYNLHCEMEQQRRRLPVASPTLKKTLFSRLASWAEVEPILHAHYSSTNFLSLSGSHDSVMEVVAPETSRVVVGGDIPLIDETNVGNRMLQGMGWRPGAGLGPDGNGIREPIRAYIRPRRSGLGF